MGEIRHGYCVGCPYDIGQPATEEGYALGCLPSVGEIDAMCRDTGRDWACHSEPDKECCGHAAHRRRGAAQRDLLAVDGVHAGRAALAETEGRDG